MVWSGLGVGGWGKSVLNQHVSQGMNQGVRNTEASVERALGMQTVRVDLPLA